MLLVSLLLGVSLSSRLLLAHCLTYADLQALDANCPERDSCEGYRRDRPYTDRSCECDFACRTFHDCCVDAPSRHSAAGRNAALPASVQCLHIGDHQTSGVYVVANCSAGWTGSPLVRQKCVGPPDFSDPMAAAPVISVAQAITYKNLYCAECNNANMRTLQTFMFKLACEGLDDLTQAQIMGDLQYNQQRRTWGVSRLNSDGAAVFVDCQIIFDVPDYLNHSVRFCRSNLVSTCAPDWTHRPAVRRHCEEYMAVVYDRLTLEAYRNPHCALCNRKAVGELTCQTDLHGRKRPMSFALLLDVNQSDGDQVGMTQVATPECPSGHKYDPFFKKCRRLVCALPNHVIVDNRCVRQGR